VSHTHTFVDELCFPPPPQPTRRCVCGQRQKRERGTWVDLADPATQPTELRFTFPAAINLANKMHGRHHMHRYKMLKAWKQRAVVTEPRLRGSSRPPTPWTRAVGSVHLYVHNIMDDDNAIAALKPAWDLLKAQGFIIDDRRPHFQMAGIPEQTIDRGNPRIEVVLRRA
jgi:hypothetical protein